MAKGALASVAVLMQVGFAAQPTEAQAPTTLTKLYRFQGGTDGANPKAGLVRDAAGNLYGATESGGGTSNYGTVFKIDSTGNETVLYRFAGDSGGENPVGGLIRDAAGNLYGTTLYGGDLHCNSFGCGTVFRLDPAGNETVLHQFAGPGGSDDGAYPYAGLIRDTAGNLYGTTQGGGGQMNRGTVFKVDTTGTETVLHRFTGIPDGQNPTAGLILDSAGNLYGTTEFGGSISGGGYGTVFKIDPTGVETVLYRFQGIPDGAYPYAGLIRDSVGNLYGATLYGGGGSGLGSGTVFKLDPQGVESVLHHFSGGSDGEAPIGLVQDASGNLYGTTLRGGPGYGVIFEINSAGTQTLWSFDVRIDGGAPYAGLVRDATGNLYGTTNLGGGTCKCGTVFRLSP